MELTLSKVITLYFKRQEHFVPKAPGIDCSNAFLSKCTLSEMAPVAEVAL